MQEQTVAPGLDHKAIAKGLGELVEGNGYDRVIVDGKTLAYIKKKGLAARAAHLGKLPKNLGSPELEKNGVWAFVAVESDAAARAVLLYVLTQVEEAS